MSQDELGLSSSARSHLRDAARQRIEHMEVMAQRLAHDLNNVLQPVLGYLHLARTADDPGKVNEYLDRALAGGDRVRELLAKLSAVGGRERGASTVVPLSDVVSESVGRVRSVLDADVELLIDDSAVFVDVSADGIHEVLTELCRNAAEASGNAIAIRVGTAVVDDAAPTMPALEPGRYAVVSVADDGAGMSPETRERIFDPLFSTHTGRAGRGLGLVLVYDFAVAFGGALRVESAPGRGTLVVLYLPVGREAGARDSI